EHPVEPAAEVAGDQPEDDAEEDRGDDGEHDGEQRRLGTPQHPGEDVVPADRGAPPELGRRRRLAREVPVGAAQLVGVVGREQRREDGHEDERGADDEAGDEHPALQADAAAQLPHDGEPLPAGLVSCGAGQDRLGCGGHQYLTRGSMRAARTSTTKFVTATMTASSATIPWTATKSREPRYWASWKPRPRHSKVVSVRIAPPIIMAICMPMTVMIGMSAGL